jgi:hypothetical protein
MTFPKNICQTASIGIVPKNAIKTNNNESRGTLTPLETTTLAH